MTKNSKNYLVETKNLEGSEMKLIFKVPTMQFDKYIEKAVEKAGKEMKIDGFRSGKIPKEIAEKQIGSEKLLFEGVNLAVHEVYVNAVIDNKIRAVGEPKVEIKKAAKGNDLEFEATVGILPEITVENWQEAVSEINKKYQQKETKASDKEVDRELDFLANQRAKVITVNREAKKGDQVEIDFQAFQDKVILENGSAKKHQLVLGDGKFIPGFEDELIGVKAGDEREFDLAFPQEYHAKHLAGKKATFKVQVSLVQERQVPKIDNEFAKGIGKFKSLDELKKNIRGGIEHEKKHQEEDRQKKEIIDALIGQANFKVPNVLVEQELLTMMSELEQDIARIGLTKEKYLEQMKITEEKLKENWRDKDAINRVKAALILRQLAKDEKMSPKSEEIEKRVNQALQHYSSMGQEQDKIDIQRLHEAAKGSLTNELVFEMLMEAK